MQHHSVRLSLALNGSHVTCLLFPLHTAWEIDSRRQLPRGASTDYNHYYIDIYTYNL